MRTKRAAAMLSLSLALAALGAAGPALADEVKKDAPGAGAEEASRRFKSGVTFYKDKDFAAALVEFKRAYELVPNYAVLYNLGQTARELKDYAAALAAFEQYLAEGGAKIPSPRRKEVSTAVEELRRKVGRIKVVTSVDGADVTVDDVAAGTSPLANAVVANVGRHKLSISRSGYTPAQRVVDVSSMEEVTVSLDLVKIDAGRPKGDGPETAPKRVIPLTTWVALGATGAVGIAAGVTGGLALSAHSSLKSALNVFPGNPSTIASAQSKTRSLAIATDVLGGLTIAGAAATTVLFLLPPRASEKATVTVSLVSLGNPAGVPQTPPTGVVVRGTF